MKQAIKELGAHLRYFLLFFEQKLKIHYDFLLCLILTIAHRLQPYSYEMRNDSIPLHWCLVVPNFDEIEQIFFADFVHIPKECEVVQLSRKQKLGKDGLFLLILLILLRKAKGRREVSTRVVNMMLVKIREVDGSSLTFLDDVNIRVIAFVVSIESHILPFGLEAVRFVCRDGFCWRPDWIAIYSSTLFLHKNNKN